MRVGVDLQDSMPGVDEIVDVVVTVVTVVEVVWSLPTTALTAQKS